MRKFGTFLFCAFITTGSINALADNYSYAEVSGSNFPAQGSQNVAGPSTGSVGPLTVGGTTYQGSAQANTYTGLLGVSSEVQAEPAAMRATVYTTATIVASGTVLSAVTAPEYAMFSVDFDGDFTASASSFSDIIIDLSVEDYSPATGATTHIETNLDFETNNVPVGVASTVQYAIDGTKFTYLTDSYDQATILSESFLNLIGITQQRILVSSGDTLSINFTMTGQSTLGAGAVGTTSIDATHTASLAMSLPSGVTVSFPASFLSQAPVAPVSPVPEPGTGMLMMTGLAGLLGIRRVRRATTGE